MEQALSGASPSLRQTAVDAALRATDRAPLQAFLDERNPALALLAWFGPAAARVEGGQLARAIERDIATLDTLLSRLLDSLLHCPAFQRLEAAWRGLRYLVDRAEPRTAVRIKVLDARWSEICRDLQRAIEFDQSVMFDKVYEQEFGQPGGEPFGLLIGNYAMRHAPAIGHPTDDVAGLAGMAQVAAAAFCPFVTGADPSLFGLDGFDEIGVGTDLAAPWRQAEYARWNNLRLGEDTRFLGIAVPYILLRPRHAEDPFRNDGFRYEERIRSPRDHLWGNAAFAFAGVVVRAYGDFHWSADIRGVQRDESSGGLVGELPMTGFTTERIEASYRVPGAANFTDRQENDLIDLGFMSMAQCHYTPWLAYFGTPSLHRPPVFDRVAANNNARLSSMLQYVLCVSRFAHYLKVLGREHIGGFDTPEDCEAELSRWLMGYCNANDDPSFDERARFPLRSAQVQVAESHSSPGKYFATVWLQPQFQLDQVLSSFRLVTQMHIGASK